MSTDAIPTLTIAEVRARFDAESPSPWECEVVYSDGALTWYRGAAPVFRVVLTDAERVAFEASRKRLHEMMRRPASVREWLEGRR